MDESEKEAIRRSVDIVDLIGRYTQLKRAGSKWKGICPFHNERTPSFNVDPEQGRWRCFGACGTGGDIFTFLEKAENLSFMEAAERLASIAGITLTPRGGNREESNRARDERDHLFSANAMAQRFFRQMFQKADFAKDYATRRGLTHQTIEAFGIGYAPDDWTALSQFLQRNGVHGEDAEKARLVFPSRRIEGEYTDQFRGRLMFPIIDVQERIVGFGGRIIVPNPNAPKYLNSPETPVFAKSRILYALNRARKAISQADKIIVVEGYMDVVACHQAGIEYVVATLGTSLTDEHVRLIGRYTKNVILCFDADTAGVRAALRAAELFVALNDKELNLRVLTLPAGDDPGSFLLDRGDVTGFQRAIDKTRTVPEFRLETLQNQHTLTDDTGKMAFLREAIPVLAEVSSPLERDVLIGRLAPYHPAFASGGGRAEESIRQELKRVRPNSATAEDVTPKLPAPERRGPPTAYRQGQGQQGQGNGNFNNYQRNDRNGYPRRGGYGYQSAIQPPPEAGQAEAGEALSLAKAESTLLRALLSEEWTKRVRERLRLDLFTVPIHRRFAEALLTLLAAGVSVKHLSRELADPALSELADSLLFQDEGEPLSEQAILDCLTRLQKRLTLEEIREIEAKVGRTQGGNTPVDDETLRQWERRQRALKGVSQAEPEP